MVLYAKSLTVMVSQFLNNVSILFKVAMVLCLIVQHLSVLMKTIRTSGQLR